MPPPSTFSLAVTRSSTSPGDGQPVEVFAMRDSQPASAREVHLDLGGMVEANDVEGSENVKNCLAGSIAYNVVYAATTDENLKLTSRGTRRPGCLRRAAASSSSSASVSASTSESSPSATSEGAALSTSNLGSEFGTLSSDAPNTTVALERPAQVYIPSGSSTPLAAPPLYEPDVRSNPMPRGHPHWHSQTTFPSQPQPRRRPRCYLPRWKIVLILKWILLRRFLRSVWRKLVRFGRSLLPPFLRTVGGEDEDEDGNDGSSVLTQDVDLNFESMCEVDVESQFEGRLDGEGKFEGEEEEDVIEMCVLGAGARRKPELDL